MQEDAKKKGNLFGLVLGTVGTLLALYIGGYVFTKGAIAAGGRGAE